MLLTIPHNILKIEHIHISPFQIDKYGKKLARLTYENDFIKLHDVSLMSPPIKIIDYDPQLSRLRLDISGNDIFKTKIEMLHDYIISTFFLYQYQFLEKNNLSHESIKHAFYHLLDGSILSLYIHPFFSLQLPNGSSSKIGSLKNGDFVRFVITFYGISRILKNDHDKLRFQYSIPSISLIEGDALCLSNALRASH